MLFVLDVDTARRYTAKWAHVFTDRVPLSFFFSVMTPQCATYKYPKSSYLFKGKMILKIYHEIVEIVIKIELLFTSTQSMY